MVGGMRAQELLIILVILLLLFGSTKLPKLGASLGSSIRNFKKGFEGKDEGEGNGSSADPAGLSQGAARTEGQPAPKEHSA